MDLNEMSREELAQELHTSRIKLMQQQKMIDECAAIESDYHALELKYDECEKNLQKLVRAKEKADEEIETLREMIEQEHILNEKLTEELENSKKQANVPPSPSPAGCNCDSFILSLQHKVKEMEEELDAMKNHNAELIKQYSELEGNYQSTAHQLENMTSLYESKREELLNSRQMIENLTEDKVLLEAELNQLRVPDVNVNQRGNSLFAEVEDKRQSTAKNLEVMKIKYNKLSQKYTQAHEELKKLKEENIELLNEASNDKVRRIEAKMMESYRTRIKDLEKQLAVYSKRPESPVIQTIDIRDLEVVSGMLDRARSDAESLRVELLRKSQSEHEQGLHCYMAERKLRMSETSIKAKEKEIAKLNARLSELEETAKEYEKLRREIESGNKENGAPQESKKSTKSVRFCANVVSQEGELNKAKLVRQPKVFNQMIMAQKAPNHVLQVSNEEKNKDALKKAE
ncbi:unnamed protein product [Bemisia tabaci]|uniref:Uncharacterized protein n=1 Tax=Bemisia tabaci TaxID=7038 RepID=A0A9P0EYN0_BEMTA|nr:unnamed protein product [Bemisia tabaci]